MTGVYIQLKHEANRQRLGANQPIIELELSGKAPNVASVVGSLNLRRTQHRAALSVSSDKSGCNAGYSNTVEQNFFEEPGGIVAHRRHQIGCHVFLFPQACLLFPLLS